MTARRIHELQQTQAFNSKSNLCILEIGVSLLFSKIVRPVFVQTFIILKRIFRVIKVSSAVSAV